MRLTDAEREQVVALLRRHLDDQRIDTDEYSRRVDEAFAAHSREQLDSALDGLPLLPPAVTPSRGRRHGERARAHAGWRPTDERFRDPSTNRVMRVWIDIVDGSRHYLPDSAV
jgi:hypothetical protein